MRDLDELTDDPLTDRVRIWQRKRGHRYSLDDVLTAHEALRACPGPERYADVGCGIGSVLLMVWDRARPAYTAGVEAQAQSAELARRNIARAGAEIRLVEGDLRDPEAQAQLEGPFDLVTGTPPYAPPGTATPSPDPQRAHARIEYRGGIEAYALAASRLMGRDGVFVVCASCALARAQEAAQRAQLHIRRTLEVVPREGRKALFHVWTMTRSQGEGEHARFVARDRTGGRTDAYVRVREDFGLGSRPTSGFAPTKLS